MNEKTFRAEVAGWMTEHLTGEFACLRHRGGPGDEEAFPALRKAWEQELASGGWIGLSWPEAHGGRELPLSLQLAFHEEYVRAGGPGRTGHIGETLLAPTLIALGTPEQQRRFLPGIRAGREFWCQGYSEPGAGSDLAAITTRCWQEDGVWRIQGQKVWTSLAHESEWIFVLARSTPGSVGREGLTFLLVPLAQDGIEIQPIRQMTGEAEFNAVFFDGAKTDAGCVVGAPGDGWRVAMALLGFERGASTLGQQMHFIHELQLVVDVARGNGAARDPVVRQRIADAWIGLEGLRHNATRMLSSAESSRPRPETLIYKYAWSNWHRDLGQLAMDVLGAAGDLRSDDDAVRRLQQVFFFSRADTIYAGTNEIQLNIIAERALAMPR
ncbi:MAG TPA: acyl-CoA dehydrogenase family protein [Aromatoleum sp.]|uniref:acyl-CoA dehydrogenase family protein n=1 Tax=Aromatoleum sp. TaxID=2307007 RepID=UPI002B47FE70|nr:acyl-CoA dehydrogenase family protein [Aromatoleum sp.]HJV27676.1 acyl-CoA dehydrogenase family protein [Aromatoleum sp.]